jgi:hypothetical protein
MPFAASCFIFNLALFSPRSGFFSDRGGGGYPAAEPVAAGIAGEDYDRKDPSPDSAIGMPTSQSFSSLEIFFLLLVSSCDIKPSCHPPKGKNGQFGPVVQKRSAL